MTGSLSPCDCGHRLARHDRGLVCTVSECHCAGYEPEPSGHPDTHQCSQWDHRPLSGRFCVCGQPTHTATSLVTDLADFLLARIAEDEQRGANCEGWTECDESYGCPAHMPPFRWAAECDAKRQIIAAHPLGEGCGAGWDNDLMAGCLTCIRPGADGETIVTKGPCLTLRLLASPYASHPDYRSEWAT